MKPLNNTLPSRKKTNYFLFIIFAISISIFIFKNTPIVEFVQGEMQRAIGKQKSFLYSLGRDDTDTEIKKLKKENMDLNTRLAEYEKISQDNIALRSQFESSGIESQALAHGKILGFTGDSALPETLVINIGLNDKIQNGMAVVVEKYLIGKISAVSLNFSVVTTVLSPKFKTLAKVSLSGANGILLGNRDFMILDRVLITEKLENNGLVVTRGEINQNGIGIYPDLVIGKISAISKNDAAPFQGAQVSPIVDFSKLKNVFVIVSM